MNVSRLLNAFSAPNASSVPAAVAATPPAASPVVGNTPVAIPPERTQAFREIASQYDLRNISPHDFS